MESLYLISDNMHPKNKYNTNIQSPNKEKQFRSVNKRKIKSSTTHYNISNSKLKDNVFLRDWLCLETNCLQKNKRNTTTNCKHCGVAKNMDKLKEFTVFGYVREFSSIHSVLDLVNKFIEFDNTKEFKSVTFSRDQINGFFIKHGIVRKQHKKK
eukprot:127923_1